MENCRGRGKLCKFFAVMLALLILAHSVFFPVRARATGTLASIAGATVVAAWLMTCGIYPYISEDGQTFGDWGAGQLRDLWNNYIDSFADGQTPSGGTKETFDKISGFVTGKTIAIAKGFWSELRAFANWIVDKFSVTDNQTGVIFDAGVNSGIYLGNYTGSVASMAGNIAAWNLAVPFYSSSGFTVGFLTCNFPYDTILLAVHTGNAYYPYAITRHSVSASENYVYRLIYSPTSSNKVGVMTPYYSFLHRYNNLYYTDSLISADSILDGIPIFSSVDDMLASADSFFNSGNSAVTVDTTTVSIPDALPETATHGGLTVPDSQAPTAPAIEAVIEQGVTDRTQPLVIPTVVEIPADVEITDDGTITENPVVVTPEDIPINADAYTLPVSITTVFPFSIPWDIYRVFQALNAEPQLPEVTIKFPALGTADEDYDVVISIPPKQWESDIEPFLIWFRRVELVVMCVGITLAMARFIKR